MDSSRELAGVGVSAENVRSVSDAAGGARGRDARVASCGWRFPTPWLLGPLMTVLAIIAVSVFTGRIAVAEGRSTGALRGEAVAMGGGRSGGGWQGDRSGPASVGASARGHLTGSDCMKCHTIATALSHPVDVTPTFAFGDNARDLPLVDGKVTCTTCHQDTLAAHETARKTRGSMLRSADAATLCAACHSEGGLSRQTQHALAVGRAHLGSMANVLSKRTSAGGAMRMVGGSASRTCLGCHDGTVASDAFNPATASLHTGHPIDVAYNDAVTANKDRALAPKRTLDSRVQLEGGNVSCTSCHGMYSREKGLLVMSNRDSALCLSCHTMR